MKSLKKKEDIKKDTRSINFDPMNDETSNIVINAILNSDRIIIVEDDPLTISSIERIIRRKLSDKEVVFVDNAKDLEERIEEITRNTVVFLDNNFPKKKNTKPEPLGKEYYKKIEKKTSHVYIISASSREEFEGMNYIGKINFGSILLKVKR